MKFVFTIVVRFLRLHNHVIVWTIFLDRTKRETKTSGKKTIVTKCWRVDSHITNTIGIRDGAECSGSHGVFLRRNYYVETGRRGAACTPTDSDRRRATVPALFCLCNLQRPQNASMNEVGKLQSTEPTGCVY